MRVVVVSAWEPWHPGHGGVWVLHHHLRELAPRHDITVLAAGAPAREAPVPGAQTLPNVRMRWFGTDRPRSLDYALRRARGLAVEEPSHVWYVERPALLASAAEMLGSGTDLVYAFGWGTARLHRLGERFDLPVVHTAIDAWALGRAGRLLPGWRGLTDIGERRAVRRHERVHYPRLDAVTVVADIDAAYLRREAPEARVEVVANGVDAGPDPRPLPAAPVLGFHGNYDSQHNVEGAVTLVRDVWPRVRHQVPEARVLIAGRSPTAEVRALSGDGVTVVADAPDLRPVLDDVTVGVVVMTSGTGLKNKVLETMAAGRPVVANPAGLAGIGAGSGLLPAQDAADAADVVVDLLCHPQRLRDAGAAARSRVISEFTWAASAARLEGIWTDVAAGRRARS